LDKKGFKGGTLKDKKEERKAIRERWLYGKVHYQVLSIPYPAL
jgi:hypothetical protein